MAFTYVEIEREKSRTLASLAVFLCVLYGVSLYTLFGGARLVMGFADPRRWWLSPSETMTVFGFAVAATLIHWLISTHQLVERVLDSLGARPLDPQDTYHAQFQHIVEEVAVAIGGRRIEARVMPTVAANACAVADFDGRAVIVVTEGLLARLNRSQLEAVVGHEAAHVASGDCLTSSIFCSLFALHEEMVKDLGGVFDNGEGRLGILTLFAYLVAGLTSGTAHVAQMCISREKEYRADATAVRLTRDPLALAEALSVIERQWRGAGAQGEALSPLFILDTGVEALSEEEGWFAELFSTHPPTVLRIAALVRMAHVAPEDFAQEMTERFSRPAPRTPAPTEPVAGEPGMGGAWLVWREGTWQGPRALADVTEDPQMTPETWVRREGSDEVRAASQEPLLLKALRRRYQSGPTALTGSDCPKCGVSLLPQLYEGVTIPECPACGGRFVRHDQLSRIFARREYDFAPAVQRLGAALSSMRGRARILKHFAPRIKAMGWGCPDCGGALVRKFYTLSYLVVVEQCITCGLTWVDRQELELLQYIHERSAEL